MTERTYDLYSHTFKANAYKTFKALRTQNPILRQLSLDGTTMIWFVSRYDNVEAVLRDPRFVRDERSAKLPDQAWQRSPLEDLISNHMLNKDGDDHHRLRALVSQAFTPKRVRELRPRIQAIADELLDGLQTQGEMDLISDFAFHLPTIVILEMLGVPTHDREKFKAWLNAAVSPVLNESDMTTFYAHMQAFMAYLRELFAARRAESKDDLISALIQAEEEGDSLSENELFSTVFLLIVAGHETTVNLISNSVLALLLNPDALAELKNDPTLMPNAVEEFLRFDGSVERALNRWAAEDVELRGQTIHRGDPAILILGAANHDPEKFARPDDLRVTRQPNPHLGFGKGVHYCLGAPLARLETEIALNTLLQRLPSLSLNTSESTLRWRNTPGFKGLEALSVAWGEKR
ncbi:cytochrome P450 [soil metagenome]